MAINLRIRPSKLLKEVEEEGILNLLFDAKVLSEAMPKIGENPSLTSEIEQKYKQYGIGL